jgi:hypothetical protein
VVVLRFFTGGTGKGGDGLPRASPFAARSCSSYVGPAERFGLPFVSVVGAGEAERSCCGSSDAGNSSVRAPSASAASGVEITGTIVAVARWQD